MRKSAITSAALCGLVLMLVTSGLVAQTITGSVQGFVTDPNGGALPGVTVTVRNQETGLERVSVSNAQGFYSTRAIDSGTYTVRAELEGMGTIERPGVQVQIGQAIDVNIEMSVQATEEIITVTAESPLIEVSRSGSASYTGEVEIEALPITGRDFKDFALLSPTVQTDTVRGFVTMSGQRGTYTGLTVDGTDNKSAFFAYGRGGEATENDGLVVAQDAVKEFQVITSGYQAEFGRSGGGSINVITRSGTNETKGSAFFYWRDQSMAEDLPSSPLDGSRNQDGSQPIDDFDRKDWGLNLGGAIKQDKTHYFLAYDQVKRTNPFTQELRTRSQDTPEGISTYDAVALRALADPNFAALIEGYERNADGSATGLFNRNVDNMILFGKLDQQWSNTQNSTFQINWTDYERTSSFKDEESLKTEQTTSFILSHTSIIGSDKVNEFRAQFSDDNLDRLSQRVGEPIEAQIRFRFASRDSVGKFDFLPILVEENQLQLKDDFSYLFGSHDTKFGVDYSQDPLKQLFAGSKDGRYDYGSITSFLNNDATGARIYFGNVGFPNYDETQERLAIYGQDSWRRNNLTVNYGLRWEGEFNPDGLEHIFPEGRRIPDDTNNWGPRAGIAWTPNNGQDVLRAGVGLFFGSTPTLLFASQVQENGIYPNYGRVFVGPGDPGYVPLGQPIDNENPPAETIPSTSFVDPNWDNAEFRRINIGYDREIFPNWLAGVDILRMDGSNLQTNVDLNRSLTGTDEFGRPLYSDVRPDPRLQTIFVRRGIGESEYTAATLKIEKRFADNYQLQAHYTWSEDKDTDSNERSATSVTASVAGLDPTTNQYIERPNYDFGFSDRDITNRFLVSGLARLPLGFMLSGSYEWRSGTPWSAIDPDVSNYPGGNGPDELAVIGGQLSSRGDFRDENVQLFNLRASWGVPFGDRYKVDLYWDIFNVFDQNSFNVAFGQAQPGSTSGITNDEFGIPDILVTTPRQMRIGARFSF